MEWVKDSIKGPRVRDALRRLQEIPRPKRGGTGGRLRRMCKQRRWCRRPGEMAGTRAVTPVRMCRAAGFNPRGQPGLGSKPECGCHRQDSRPGSGTRSSVTHTCAATEPAAQNIVPSPRKLSALVQGHRRGGCTEDKMRRLCCLENVRADSKAEVIREEMNSPECKAGPSSTLLASCSLWRHESFVRLCGSHSPPRPMVRPVVRHEEVTTTNGALGVHGQAEIRGRIRR
ncbi:uncharacterized protein LOC122237211 isoform X1 [Panthera tigris]|uniref:uncharacterized protein LOC122237211 isoform X1 n=1 Tax=Panthera tigris TaxID=9694 RepID=UPI001C6F7AD1|nr:uncharacterized protein LOC122237211 isoform X1 [Panthera tigris]XP_042836399.1 uncharacterized protein LOC122237211 isoform X1 [Panthera tigris]XP_042836406.1 uncharacterized protein LOC122237211 isoform X1 [Panthera tigris]